MYKVMVFITDVAARLAVTCDEQYPEPLWGYDNKT